MPGPGGLHSPPLAGEGLAFLSPSPSLAREASLGAGGGRLVTEDCVFVPSLGQQRWHVC